MSAAALADGVRSFDEVLERFAGRVHRPDDRQDAIVAPRERFRSRFENCCILWKIHAEIQLLSYERSPNVIPTRIMFSSKSACYLYDLFVKCYGQFQLPKTPDRIYEKWTLPE